MNGINIQISFGNGLNCTNSVVTSSISEGSKSQKGLNDQIIILLLRSTNNFCQKNRFLCFELYLLETLETDF